MTEKETTPVEGDEQTEAPPEEVGETTEAPAPQEPSVSDLLEKMEKMDRRTQYLQRQLEKKAIAPEPVVEVPKTSGRPTIENYNTTEEYEDALFEWRDNVKSVETAAQTREREYANNMQTFNQRARALRDEYDDFDDVIEAEVFSEVMKGAILHSEKGPELAYYLGLPANIDVAEKIRNLPLERQLVEMGKLESKLTIAKKTKKVPGASTPPTPVGMGGGGTAKEPTSESPIAEWMAWENDKRLKKIQAGNEY